jgi:threonine dehydrogenase-like Zn-dependent dehydrogenase
LKAIHFHDNTLFLATVPLPKHHNSDALLRICSAGICNTDIEITRGYIPGFNGIPGHEFFGCVESVPDPSLNHLIGTRVTSEINCGCGTCSYCKQGLERHCPDRNVIGIINHDGAFAEYISVPRSSLVSIPDTISDNNALFIEPLAAACEIQEQIRILPEHTLLLLGDGKLAHLIALTLLPTGCTLQVAGKHEWKTSLLKSAGIDASTDHTTFSDHSYDIVIEATGSAAGFEEAVAKVRPRGTIVLKSTYASGFSFNPAPIVVNEISLIGSRCGRFSAAIDFLEKERPDLTYLISKRFPLSEGVAAFAAAQQPDVMKVVIDT